MGLLRTCLGIALAVAANSCSLPTTPLSGEKGTPTPAPAWPPPTISAAGCDLNLVGVVTQRDSTGTRAAADATVNWRHFEGGPFDSANEFRADANGRYNVCVPTPPVVCDSGACSVKYEVRAKKPGYVVNSTSVIGVYNYWADSNAFRAPDLELAPE